MIVVAAAAGCQQQAASLRVEMMISGEPVALSAEDVVEVMLQAGFGEEEILQAGPYLRNAVATVGGATLRQGRLVEAIFAVEADMLFVSSRRRGNFVRTLSAPASPTYHHADKVPAEIQNGSDLTPEGETGFID